MGAPISYRRFGIPGKVRLALVGVLLLILPQVALTLYYLIELSKSSAILASRSQSVAVVAELRAGFRSLQVPDALTSTEETERGYLRGVDALSTRARALDADDVDIGAQYQAIADHLHGVRRAAARWFSAVRRARDVASGAQALKSILSGSPSQTGIDLGPLRDNIAEASAALELRFDAAVSHYADDLTIEQDYVKRLLDHADRNLIALTMLTCIYLAGLFLVLPGRLLRPLSRITQVIRQAEDGKLDLVVNDPSSDAVGLLARTLNRTFERIRAFDERKKDRIVEDGAKLEALLGHLGYPAAILTTGHVVDTANRAFRDVFGLTDADAETPLPAIMSEGGAALRQLLDRASHHREALSDVAVQVVGRDGPARPFAATIDVCRDRRGRVSHVLLLLRPAPAET